LMQADQLHELGFLQQRKRSLQPEHELELR
jgi:hypothetical protein